MEMFSRSVRAGELRLAARSAAESQLHGYGASRVRAARARSSAALGGFDLVSMLGQATDAAVLAVLQVDPRLLEQLRADAAWETYLAGYPAERPIFTQILDTEATAAGPTVRRRTVGASDTEQSWIVPGGMERALASECTFVINHLDQFDRCALRSLLEDLELALGHRATANCYISGDRATGFGTHWDDHNVLVVQLEGRKLWEVFEPAVLSPAAMFARGDAVGAPAWSGLLAPGQALLIPRGWAHRVTGLDELSVHYTISVSGFTFRSLLSGFDGPEEWRPDDPDALRSWIAGAAMDSGRLVEQALALSRSMIPVRARSGIGTVERWRANGSDPSSVRVLMPGGPVFCDDPREDGGAVLAWANQAILLAGGEIDALVALPERTPTAEALCRDLIGAGLARIEAP